VCHCRVDIDRVFNNSSADRGFGGFLREHTELAPVRAPSIFVPLICAATAKSPLLPRTTEHCGMPATWRAINSASRGRRRRAIRKVGVADHSSSRPRPEQVASIAFDSFSGKKQAPGRRKHDQHDLERQRSDVVL